MTDHKRNLYDALSTKFDIGTYEEFESKIDNEEHRKRLYDAVSQTYDIGTYDEYNAKLGYQSNVTADDEDRPSFGETAVKGLGAAAVRTGKLALDLGRMAWNTSVLGGAANKIRQWANPEQGTIDEELRDETNPLTRASMRLGEVADKLSREADPTGGEKGYVQLLKEGKIGQVAQKALGSGLESLPMMIAAGTGWGALLYGAGMAAGEYSDETRENPDIPAWKRGVNAMGSAAIEMAVEKIGGPLKNIGSAGKEITEEMAKEILETAVKEGTENAAKRIIKKIGKEGLEEGGEELLTSFGNDALGQALDWIDGDADYGITAQWEQMKEQNPDAKLSDFAWAKAEEYMDSFIGGAVSGMEISSAVEGANYLANRRAMQAAREFGAAKNYGDMYDTDSDVASSTESVINAFAGNDGEQAVSNEFISSLSADDAFALSGREELSGEQRRALRQLAISKATQDGLNQKLDEELEKNLAVMRERTEKLSDNGQIVTGIYNGKPVYIKGGVVNNGSVSATNDGANGPVIVIDGATGEETTANSKDISSVYSVDLTTFINDSEAIAREAEAQNREIARNTMSVNAKYNAIRPLEGKKLKVDLGSGIIDVQIERILPQTGEVLIKGKKGDLNGQSNTKIGIGAFYDSIYRDDEGNPIFAEGVEFAEEESTDNTAVDEPIELTGEEDFRDFVGTILINGVPTEVEVMSQDNPTDSIVYTYIDENGRAQRGTTTIRGFAESVQQASSYNTEPAPQPEPAPTTEPIDEPISNGPSVDIPLTPQAIDWDVLFEQDPENYFVELQNQYGDETLDILNEEIEAAQEELDALGKKRGRTQNERLENRKKKATLQQRIEVLNGMVARLAATPKTAQEAPADVATEQPSFESAEQVPAAAESPAESATEVPQEDEPIQSIVKQTPVAPNPVANPVMEAQKKERLLAINLNKIMPHEQKQDIAFNAGKAVGDFFATREEYDAYAENATDFGEYNEDFERGIEASFANRSKIESVSPANSVSLETEPKGENNGENGQAYTGESSSGQSDRSSGVQQPANRRGEEIHQGTSEAEPEQGKNKGKGGKAGEQVDKYPARKGNATQKLLIDTFGFNSVTIPNSRKETLNTIYDFMMEMSKMLGISPKSIGQGGWLDVESLRSNATASAEHSLRSSVVDQTVVKATLKYKYAKLAGLAHEWWHALDHALSYFETGKGKIVASEINRNKFTGRPEAWEAVQAVHEAIINSGHENRIFSLSFPKKYKDYLTEPSEMIARAFDEYIKSKFYDAGIVIENAIDTDFIAQPTPEEMAVIAPAFDNLFKVLKEKEGKTPGTSVLYHIGEMMEEDSPAKRLATEAVLTALDNTGIDVVRATDEQAQQVMGVADMQKGKAPETALPEDESSFKGTAISSAAGAKILKDLDSAIEFYQTPNGIVYGWTDGKKIYLTKAGLNPNTPIHEYTHIWAKAMMLRNPKGWESIKKLLKGTPIWNEVMNDANYSNIHNDEDAVASEALSRISGAENAAKMEQMAQQMIDEAKGTGRKLEARGLIQNMRDALNKFWSWVGTNLFGIEKFESVEQITDRVLYDLLNQTDLGELSEGQVEAQISSGQNIGSEKNTNFVEQFEFKKNNERQELEYSDEFRRVQEESARMSEQLVSEKDGVQQAAIRGLVGGIGRTLQRELDRTTSGRGNKLRTVVNESKGTSFDIIENVDGRLFHDIFAIVKNYLPNGELVDLHDNYDDAICYITSDGLAGFAVTEDGNLISVYSLYGKTKKGFLGAIKDLITEAGATHLDGYNSPRQPLAEIYSKVFGWKVASMMDYNMEYDHDNIAKNHEMPQVAFMVNTDADIETRHFNKDQYDEAIAYQLEQVDKSKENSLSSQNDGNTEDAYAANDGGRIQSETEGVSGEVPVSGPLGEGRKLARPEGRPVSQDAYARFNPIHEREGESDNRRNLREARFFETFEKLTSDEQLLFYNFLNEYLNKNSGVLKSKTNDFIESIMVDGNSEFADFVEDFINDELKYREGISAATVAKHGLLVGVSYDASRLEQIFDAYNNDKYNEALFDRAIKLAKRFGVSIKFATRNRDGSFFSAFGSYNPNDNTITLDANLLVDGNTAELCQTIVHELIHSVVARAASIMSGRAVDNNKQFIDPKSLPKDVVDGINTLKEVYEAIKDDGTFQYTYGKTDFEEMLSEITDPRFRGLLKAKKLWKKFLNGICQILGITDESSSETDALTEIESALDKILSAAERGELDSAYASYLGRLAEGYTLEDLQRLEDGSVKTLLTQNALFRTGIDPTEVARETAKQVYNRVVSERYQEFQRQFQDAMQPVRIAIDAIQQETGNLPVEDYENFLLIQNQSSSRSRVEIDKFTRRYYSPIVKQVEKIIDMILESRGQNKTDKDLRAKVYGEIRKYMIAKHGLERNLYYQSHNTRKLRQSEKDKATAEAQNEYDEKVNAINADTSLTDAESELQLREAKDAFDAALLEIDTREVPNLRDYSGLTALFGMEPKKFKKAEEEAQVLVDNFEAQIGEASEELWKRINKATNKTLRHSYESGLLSRQQYNDIKEMFQFYIPLRGFDETTAEDVYSYARFEGNKFNPAVQTAKGRTSIADDPLAIIMNMAESEIAQGNKNRAKQALYNFILNRTITDADGNERQNSLMQIEDVWYLKNEDSEGNVYYTIAVPNHEDGQTYEEFEERMKALAEEEKAYKSKKGKVDIGMRFQKPANANAHYVYLKVNGVEKAIYINGDPKAAEAINGANREQLGEFAQKMRGINRILSSTFTNYSLEFTARNYFRDMIYSHINIGIREQDPAYRKKFRQNWRHNNLRTMMSLLKAYRAGEFEGRPLNEDEAAFVEFIENGGQTGYTLINSVENHKKDLERAIKNMQNGIEHGGVKDSAVFKATLGGIELLNESSELVTRFAAFKTSRDMGRSVVKSISDAKEITVNFNTKGAQDGKGYAGWIARYLGLSKFFFNASVQGVQNIKAMHDANKLKFCTTVGGIMAFGFAMPIIVSSIAALLGSDDDEEYWNIPEYDRQNNFCIPVGGGKYVKIPLPIGFREVYAMGDMLAAMAFDKKFTRDVKQVGMDMANKIASVVLPINPLESSANGLSIWHTLLYTALPSSMQFLVQNATNIDWKGAPLQKEYTYNENDPQWMKAYASNPDWMVSLSKWCNEHIGAGDFKGMDWSPEKLDNTLSSLFGGIYSLVKKTGKSFSMIWNEENRNLSNIPLSGVVLGLGIDKDDRFVTDAYYDEKEYYDDRIGFIKRRAEKFGYDLNDVFLYKKGNHHPKMMEIYNNREFDFMQEWYKGNKDLEALEKEIKKFEKEIAKHDNPSEGMLNRLAEMKDRLAVEKREFVDDMLELD